MIRKLNRATTIGGGVIGSSFTLLFALGGMEVINYNRRAESQEKVENIIDSSLKQLVDSKMIEADEVESIKSKISYTLDMNEAIRFGDYIQENLPENYEVKQEFVKTFEEIADVDVVMGSSTSGLLVTEIAKFAKNPERIVGAHPYNPPHLIPLIEISQGEKSDPKVADAVKEMFEKLDKKPIILRKEAPGFISNRLQVLVFREIIDLVNKGIVSMEDADKALTFGPGIRWGIMGPGQIFELGGGEHGIAGILAHIGPSMETWLEDTAKWTKIPEESKGKVVSQVAESIKNRPEEIGNNNEDLAKYRDGMLVEFLKLHKNYKIK